MGLIRSTVRSVLTRIAERVARNELFEKPGERAPQPKLEPETKEPEPAPNSITSSPSHSMLSSASSASSSTRAASQIPAVHGI